MNNYSSDRTKKSSIFEDQYCTTSILCSQYAWHRFYAPNMLDIDFMLPICSTSILCSQYARHRFYAPNMLDIDFMLPICLTHIMIKISSHFIGSKRRDSSLEKSVFLSVLISIKFIECQNIFGTQKQKYFKQSGWNLKL